MIGEKTDVVKIHSGGGNQLRTSNLELFRIITMFMIVMHHYVVNSGLMYMDGTIYSNPMSCKSLILLILGAWGKIGINCFVFITGYFMCKSRITPKKFVKLLFEIEFYKIVFFLIFVLSGYEVFSVKGALKAILPITSVTSDFSSCYLIFYLCIPFINILVHSMKEIQHISLIVLMSFIYVFFGTIPLFHISMNYVSWFMVLYLISSYIRLYPRKLFENTKFWGIMSAISIFLSICSVIVCVWLGEKIGRYLAYQFVSDSNTFLALFTGLSAFMFFKNLKIQQSNFINTVAASTFGVLLIHANSDTMRQWLWKDTLNNVGAFKTNMSIIHAVISVCSIYIICTIIDYLRIRFIEKPFFKLWDKHWEMFARKLCNIGKKFCASLKISQDI